MYMHRNHGIELYLYLGLHLPGLYIQQPVVTPPDRQSEASQHNLALSHLAH
jgi:hypothetical protein